MYNPEEMITSEEYVHMINSLPTMMDREIEAQLIFVLEEWIRNMS